MTNSLWIRCGALEQDKHKCPRGGGGGGGGGTVNQVCGHSDSPATPIQEQFKFHKLGQWNSSETTAVGRSAVLSLIPAGSKWRSKLPYCSLVSLLIWDSPHVSERYEYSPLFGRNQRSRRHWTQWRKERLFIPEVLAKSRVQIGRAKTWSDNGGFGYVQGIVPNFLERLQHAGNWI